MFIRTSQTLLATAATAALLSAPAFAQDVPEDEIIVTGVAKATTAFDSSASVSALSDEAIQNLAPRSINELFRSLPGIKAEDTGGDANANIKVRGLPIASGGSRYFSMQENGFPTLLIGDTAFATADSFVRVDSTIGSVQSIRGGSAATQAPNAAGGIVNLISKKPVENGGSVGVTAGLNYDSIRVDAEYGGVFGDGGYYHIGGFARKGEGVRDVRGNQEEGYQIKATVGKDFDRGNLAVHFKHLDDRVPTYLPLPGQVQSNGDIGTIGLDLGDGTNSLGLTDYTVRADGDVESNKEGFQAKMTSIGAEGNFDLTENVTLGAKGRYADISGNFYSPFPFAISGPNADGYEEIDFALFNTSIPNMNNFFGDVNIQGNFDRLSIKAGIEYADQNSEQNWNFNQARAILADGYLALNGAPGSFTNPSDGSYIDGYSNAGAFGGCCTRVYDFEIEQFAPYISANIELDNLTFEASYRRSENNITGQFSENSTASPIDANGDGTIASNEQAVRTPDLTPGIIDLATLSRPSGDDGGSQGLYDVDYDADYDAFSIGANYQVSDRVAIFANYSEGASVTAPDRATGLLRAPSGATSTTGNVLSGANDQFLNFVDAYEIGAKFKLGMGDFSIVYFDAQVAEGGQLEASTQRVIQNSFDTNGIEIEGNFFFDQGFGIRGNATFTDSEIAGPTGNTNIGNTPRRQAPYIYNVNPYYEGEGYDLGLNIFGTGKAPVQDGNQFDLPAYTTVGAYVNFDIRENLEMSLNANNLFDAVGFSEGEEGAPAVGDFVRFRPINGRTVSATVRYNF